MAYDIVLLLCYADDIALLAPSPSALRALLRECELFAIEHNLQKIMFDRILTEFLQH